MRTIKRRDWTKPKLKAAIRVELDKKPGLYCIDLSERLGADLREIGDCLDELVAEKKVEPMTNPKSEKKS